MGRVVIALGAVGVLAATLAAQQTAPAFEVASIRPSAADSRAPDESEGQPSGRFVVTNTTLDALIRSVFEVQRHELVLGDGVPSWFTSQRWDIVGKGRILACGTLAELREQSGQDDLEELFFSLVS